jgi:hypothetical protein
VGVRSADAANLEAAIYVLHAFQKTSTKGIKTAKRDIDMIDRRLRDAREIDRVRGGGKGERRCAVNCPSTRSAAATCLPMSACRMPSFTC